ncbi:ABC transporter permease [Ornithinibacillus sp. 4-3]|uniref:ABC transporter permease n=1 Tax=Ornithinibacillus sp. 4-3 TaxID=3231488 RepID=A0AB39HTN2_9BACI
MNTQRIFAIFEKDMKDFMKNTMTLFMPIVPIILAFFYSRIGGDEEMPIEMIYLVVGVIFSSVSAGGIMIMMAEENEKQTLRGLTLSPATIFDVLVGKSLVIVLLTIATMIISLAIMGMGPILDVKVIIGLIILFLFFLFLGIGIGLFVKTVGMTTAYLMPIMFLFGFTPMVQLLGLEEGSLVLKIFNYFPMIQLIDAYYLDTWTPIFIVAIWVIVAAIFMYVCFKRTMKDE